jgi:hypothetical protein
MNYKLIIVIALFVSFFALNTNAQEERNFYLDGWIPRNYEEPSSGIERILSAETNDAVINVSINKEIAKVLPTHFGVNTPFRNGDGMLYDSIRVPMYEQARLGAFRFPAGSGSNKYFWDGNPPSEFLIELNPISALQSSALKPENFVTFIDSMGSQATVVVNYFYARYGETPEGTREARVKQAAEYAAGFVHRMNIELNAGIQNWEIGNECYGAWEEGYNVNGSIVTGTEYGEDFRVFAEEMKKVDSTIKVGAVLYTKDTDWNPQVIREVQDDADFFIIHDYFTPEKDATVENIFGSVGKIKDDIDLLSQTVEQETDKTLDHFPVTLTEFNCRGYHTTTMTDGMFVTQILGEVIKNNLGLSALWVSEWKWNSTQEPKSFLALQDPAQDDYTARPSYMPYHFYGKCFGDRMLEVSLSGEGVNAYASRFSSGEVGVVVINMNGTNTNVGFNLTGLNPATVQWYEVYSPTIGEGDKKFFINGETGTTPGGGPTNFYEIPPYKASFNGTETITLPGYSINFLVIEGEEVSVGFRDPLFDEEFVFPNPAGDYLIIKNKQSIMEYIIYNEAGELIKRGQPAHNRIDTSELESGYHILNIQLDNYSKNIAFLKL